MEVRRLDSHPTTTQRISIRLPGYEPGSVDGPEAVYDVTPIVVDWAAQGADKNFGFVLMTDDQGIGSFTETWMRNDVQRYSLARGQVLLTQRRVAVGEEIHS